LDSELNISRDFSFKWTNMPRDQKQTQLPHLLAILLLCVLTAGCGRKERTLYSPPANGNPAHPPAVRIIVPADGAIFHAHEDIRLLALATPSGSDLGPDEEASRIYAESKGWELVHGRNHDYSVEFLADTNRLSVQSTSMVFARAKSIPGQAQPMIMVGVGFPAVEWVWRNVPAGSHTLTARATNENGLTTISTAVTITVLP